ncbi:MAG: preprotein translocase subunit SecG [bacterium]
MQALTIIITIIQVITCVAIVAVVLLQSGKSAGLSGALVGGNNSDSFLAKNKQKSLDSKLAKATKWLGLAFVLLTLVLNIIA